MQKSETRLLFSQNVYWEWPLHFFLIAVTINRLVVDYQINPLTSFDAPAIETSIEIASLESGVICDI